jgi:hypothetical protein
MVSRQMRNLLSDMMISLDVAVFGDEGCALPQFYDCEVL